MTSTSAQLAQRLTRFDRSPVETAQRLLGQRLVRMLDGQRVSGIIVETEAYLGAADRAAHTYGGRRTKRNEAMYLAGGHAYVYFTYGMHHCMNVVCGREGEGVAVLLRAIEPEEGLDIMFQCRPAARREADLCSGPAKLCAALAIDRALNGADLRTSGELWIEAVRRRPLPEARISRTPRIGIAYAEEWAAEPLRFTVRGSRHLSR